MLSEERERLRGAADRTRGFIAFLMSDPRLAELGLAVADLTLLLEAVDALDTAERERDALRDVVGYAGREQRISANSLLNAIRERAEMVDLVQAHRPEGPPPPGGGARALLRWVLDTLALERDRAVGEARSAERERDEARAAKDVAYAERNRVVAALARMALGRSWRTGIRPHEPDPDPTWDEDWKNVVLINLPTGQVSWHYHDSDRPLFAWLPPYRWPWDGHDTAEKYRRLAALSLPPAENFEDAAHDAAAVRSLGEPAQELAPPGQEIGAGLAPGEQSQSSGAGSNTPPPRGAQEGGTSSRSPEEPRAETDLARGLNSRWRVGRKVGRTLYLDDQLVGLMDTPALAGAIASAMNERARSLVEPATAVVEGYATGSDPREPISWSEISRIQEQARERELGRRVEACGLCGQEALGYAQANGVRLCHAPERECYHRWTVYGERPAHHVDPALDAPVALSNLRTKASALRELLMAARDYDGGVPGSARLVDAALALAHAVEVQS
jgi:hypothetical protein